MITSSNLTNLRNGEVMNFFSNVLTVLNETDLEKTGLLVEVTELSVVYDTLRMHYKMERGSRITRSLVELDGARDQYFISLRGLLTHHAQGHPDPTKRAQAELLLKTVESYGTTLHRKNYQEETAGIHSIINTINQGILLTAAVKALHLEAYIEALQTANTEFDEAYLKRNSEYASIPKGKLADLRDRAEEWFEKIVLRINANLLLAKDKTPFEALTSQIDTLVQNYQDVVTRRRQGRSNTEEDLNDDFILN